MINIIALIIVAVIVGLLHPSFRLNIDIKNGKKSGKVYIKVPIFLVTILTFIFKGNVGLAFLAELFGWILSAWLSWRKKK